HRRADALPPLRQRLRALPRRFHHGNEPRRSVPSQPQGGRELAALDDGRRVLYLPLRLAPTPAVPDGRALLRLPLPVRRWSEELAEDDLRTGRGRRRRAFS